MDDKNSKQPATKKGLLQSVAGLENKIDFAIEKAEKRIDVKAQQYRDQILTAFNKAGLPD